MTAAPPPPPAPVAVASHQHFLGLSALHFGAFATGVVAFVLFGLTMARRCACAARDRRRALATRMRVLLEAVARAEAAAAALRASGVPAWESGTVLGAPLLAEPWPYVVGAPAAQLLPETGPLVELLPLHGRCVAPRPASCAGRGHCGELTLARAGGANAPPAAARWGPTAPYESSAGVKTRRATSRSCRQSQKGSAPRRSPQSCACWPPITPASARGSPTWCCGGRGRARRPQGHAGGGQGPPRRDAPRAARLGHGAGRRGRAH